MKWVKNVVVDIIVSIVIIVGVLVQIQWLEVVIIAYTALMLLLKFLAVVSEQFMKSVKKTTIEVPLWFTSSLYALNVFVLLGFAWYYTAAQWGLIWLFSWIAHKKSQKAKVKRQKVKGEARIKN